MGMPTEACLLIVDASRQRMHRMVDGDTVATLPVSTSKNGLGNVMDSYRTPTGFMKVVERYGEGEPAGRVFFERDPMPECLEEEQWRMATGQDYILTRILRLAGCEEGVNLGGEVDVYERYVYLHGSDCEQHLGINPSSHGCVHVGNHDLVTLYDQVRDQPVWCWVGEDVEPGTGR